MDGVEALTRQDNDWSPHRRSIAGITATELHGNVEGDKNVVKIKLC